VALLFVALLSSFVILPRRDATPVPQLQMLFAPVARPTSKIASWLDARIGKAAPADPEMPDGPPRLASEVYKENEELRLQLAALTAQLQQLAEINAEREAVGDIRPLCTPFVVIGADAGTRQSLALQGTSLDGLAVDQPVLRGQELVGRILTAGMGGAIVQLVVDDHFKANGGFARFEAGSNEYIPIASKLPLVQGTGQGMLIQNLSLRDVEESGLRAGDWVVLSDRDWPIVVQGRRLGRVVSITTGAPLYARIAVQPSTDLMKIREVMVLTHRTVDATGDSKPAQKVKQMQ